MAILHLPKTNILLQAPSTELPASPSSVPRFTQKPQHRNVTQSRNQQDERVEEERVTPDPALLDSNPLLILTLSLKVRFVFESVNFAPSNRLSTEACENILGLLAEEIAPIAIANPNVERSCRNALIAVAKRVQNQVDDNDSVRDMLPRIWREVLHSTKEKIRTSCGNSTSLASVVKFLLTKKSAVLARDSGKIQENRTDGYTSLCQGNPEGIKQLRRAEILSQRLGTLLQMISIDISYVESLTAIVAPVKKKKVAFASREAVVVGHAHERVREECCIQNVTRPEPIEALVLRATRVFQTANI